VSSAGGDSRTSLGRRFSAGAAAVVLLAVPNIGQAGELLVSSFVSDRVGRYAHADALHLGDLSGVVVNGPQAVRLGPDRFLYLANEEGDNVLRFNVDTRAFVDVFVAAGSGGLDGPTALTWGPDGNLYVGSFNTNSILKYDGNTGAFLSVFATDGIAGPDVGVIFGPDGNLYVPSFFNNRVLRFDGGSGASLGTFISQFAPGSLTQPRTIIFHSDGLIYVSSDNGNKVNRYQSDGTYVDTFVAAGDGGLNGASGMTFGDDGYLYVTSWRSDQVLRYDGLTGAFVDEFIGPENGGIDGPTFIMHVPDVIIPAVSTWGLTALGLMMMCAGTLLLGRHGRAPFAAR
jgi:streptogramin lyase